MLFNDNWGRIVIVRLQIYQVIIYSVLTEYPVIHIFPPIFSYSQYKFDFINTKYEFYTKGDKNRTIYLKTKLYAIYSITLQQVFFYASRRQFPAVSVKFQSISRTFFCSSEYRAQVFYDINGNVNCLAALVQIISVQSCIYKFHNLASSIIKYSHCRFSIIFVIP